MQQWQQYASDNRSGQAAGSRARGPQISDRARRRRGRRAALCRWFRCPAAAREGPHLASLPGSGRRARHLLRSALRAQPADARCPRRDHHAPGERGSADAQRDPALHEALLDQHRALQQSHRAQVHPEVRAGGLRGRCRRGAEGRREVPAQVGRNAACVSQASSPDVLRPEVRAGRHQQDTGQGQGHPHREREQPVRRRDDEGPRGASRKSIR